MIPPKYLALAALGTGVVAFAFVAGRMTEGDDSNTRSEGERQSGSKSRAGSSARMDIGSGSYASGSRAGKSGDSTRGGGSASGQDTRAAGLSEEAYNNPSGKVGPAQRLLEKKGTPLFNENYELSEDIAKALGLGDSEYRAMSQTLTKSLDEIDQLREQSIEVRSRSDSQLFLKIRSFGEKGAEVRESLQNDLRQQLGEERYSAFMLMTEDALESEYFQFGRAYQTISFNYYTSENTGTPRIRIVDEVHIPQGDGRWTILQNKGNHDTLPENYQSYLEVANRSAGSSTPAGPISIPVPTQTPAPAPIPASPSPASPPSNP